jgi:hypothetical protein
MAFKGEKLPLNYWILWEGERAFYSARPKNFKKIEINSGGYNYS